MFKKFLTNTLLTFSFFLFIFPAKAQNIAIGEWRTHLPYNQVIDVAEQDAKRRHATCRAGTWNRRAPDPRR